MTETQTYDRVPRTPRGDGAGDPVADAVSRRDGMRGDDEKAEDSSYVRRQRGGWAGEVRYVDAPSTTYVIDGSTSGVIMDAPGTEGGDGSDVRRWDPGAGAADAVEPDEGDDPSREDGSYGVQGVLEISGDSTGEDPSRLADGQDQGVSFATETRRGRDGSGQAFVDDGAPDPYPVVKKGPHAVFIVLFLLVVAALALAAFALTNGLLGSAPGSIGAVGVGAGGAASEVLEAVGAQGVSARDDARDGGWLASKTVCIDAGHGARADLTLTPIGPGSSQMQYVEPGGASGVVTGVGEYQVVLDVALLLQQKLEDAGANVVMVRTTNDVVMSSEDRAKIANECGADIFVRLHADGTDDSRVRGFSTLVPGLNEWTEPIVESSAYAAQIIHPIVIAETGANDRGIVERSDLAGFNFCEVPSLLFEIGFLSNPDEDQLLNDPEYQDVLATALCDGVITYLEAASQTSIQGSEGPLAG